MTPGVRPSPGGFLSAQAGAAQRASARSWAGQRICSRPSILWLRAIRPRDAWETWRDSSGHQSPWSRSALWTVSALGSGFHLTEINAGGPVREHTADVPVVTFRPPLSGGLFLSGADYTARARAPKQAADLLPPFDPFGCTRYAPSTTPWGVKGVAGLVGGLRGLSYPSPPICRAVAFHAALAESIQTGLRR
jgi:hypothetical protein